jgi:NADH-quinone oxidoreductase subunit G
LRQAVKKGGQLHSIHAVSDDWAMPVASTITVAPGGWVGTLASVASAVAAAKGVAAPAKAETTPGAEAIAASLLSGERKAVLLGNAAAQHPQASSLLSLAHWIGEQTGASVGYLTEAANTVGAQLVNALPGPGGLHAGDMLGGKLKAALLLNIEPAFDAANPGAAVAALQSADMVVALTPFLNAAVECADVLLPIAPFSETSGTFVNAEGRVQSFHGVVKPLADTRPGWKVLRVLGNLLGLQGFAFETSEEVRAEALPGDVSARLGNGCSVAVTVTPASNEDLERLTDVAIYGADPLVRRATSLQLTADARPPAASVSPAVWSRLGLTDGALVRVIQGDAQAVLPARLDTTLAPNAVRVPAGRAETAALGPMFGPISVAKA